MQAEVTSEERRTLGCQPCKFSRWSIRRGKPHHSWTVRSSEDLKCRSLFKGKMEGKNQFDFLQTLMHECILFTFQFPQFDLIYKGIVLKSAESAGHCRSLLHEGLEAMKTVKLQSCFHTVGRFPSLWQFLFFWSRLQMEEETQQTANHRRRRN